MRGRLWGLTEGGGLRLLKGSYNAARRAMQLNLLKSKIHRAEVTDASLNYEGSLAIDADFMSLVGLRPFERILVGNMNNGERFETYAIAAPAGSKTISLNGATAHLGRRGDMLTIMAFAVVDEREAAGWQPRVLVLADANTKIIKVSQK
jgi:aspartate 1-decarboxylase